MYPNNTTQYTASTLKRFWEKIEVLGPTDCWQWLGSRLKPTGHGRLNIKGKVHLAHRISYEIHKGGIPKGMVVRHTCNFGPCCNPSHLTLGTQAENVRDMLANNNPPIRVDHPLPGARPWAKHIGATVDERFWDKVDKSGDCWLWTGAKFSRGYGHFVVDGFNHLAHRFAWEMEHGPIPEGMILLHQCDTPSCVRVSHLQLGTHAENSADMIAKGRATYHTGKDHPGFGKQKTHCNKGHELTEDNIAWTNHGKSRRCLTCYQESNRAGALRYLNNHREEINQKRRERREPFKIGSATGERHGLTTITRDDVIAIREAATDGVKYATIASQYGVSASTVGNIARRITWKHVP